MHRFLNFNEIINNQSECVNANSRNHKSNEEETIATFASFGKTCISIHLVTIVRNISFTNCEQDGNKT
jgi:hypothetical protein